MRREFDMDPRAIEIKINKDITVNDVLNIVDRRKSGLGPNKTYNTLKHVVLNYNDYVKPIANGGSSKRVRDEASYQAAYMIKKIYEGPLKGRIPEHHRMHFLNNFVAEKISQVESTYRAL